MYPYFLFAAIHHLKSSPTFSVRPCSSVGRVTEDLIRRSWVRFPPRSLSLEQRRFLFDVLFLYKALNGHIDIDLSNYVQFFKESDHYTLRRKDDCTLKKNYARTNVFKYSYFNRIVDMWNSLPHSVRRAHSVEIFKKSVRDILIRSLWLLISFHFIVSVILFTIVFYSNYLVFIGLVLLPYCSVIIIQ